MPQCKMTLGIGEMSEGLKVLAALADDLSFIPRTHIRWIKTITLAAEESITFFGLCEYPYIQTHNGTGTNT